MSKSTNKYIAKIISSLSQDIIVLQVSLKTFSFRYYYILNSTTKSVQGKQHWKNSISFHKSNKLQNQCYWSLPSITNVRMRVQQTHVHEFISIIRPSYGWLTSEKVMVTQEISTSLIICPCKLLFLVYSYKAHFLVKKCITPMEMKGKEKKSTLKLLNLLMLKVVSLT